MFLDNRLEKITVIILAQLLITYKTQIFINNFVRPLNCAKIEKSGFKRLKKEIFYLEIFFKTI
jgi:hypothetical protein